MEKRSGKRMEKNRMIGMDPVKKMLSELVKYKEIYRRGNVQIPHMIIQMAPGNGQTYTTEAITDVLSEYKLREFRGLDEYLEYKPDESKTAIEWMFSDIEDNAIYENSYKGVVSVDVSGLVNVMNQYQMKYFEENIEKVAKNATVILYCSPNLGAKGDKLMHRLNEVLDRSKILDLYVFTPEDYAEMIVQNVEDRGIVVKDKKKVTQVLSEIVFEKEIASAKDAVHLAEQLIFYADYTREPPVLSFGKAENFKTEISKEMK